LLRPAIAVSRQLGERRRGRLHVLFDELERGADLHDRGGVGDVLGGRAPMAPFAETVGTQTDDLLHHAEDRIADALGLLLEACEIDVLDPTLPHDLARGLLGDDAEAGLCAGERGLDLEVVGRPPFIGEDRPHLRRAEDVAEDRGIERRRRHAFFSLA
jgi:hypothetical protein